MLLAFWCDMQCDRFGQHNRITSEMENKVQE